MNPSLRDVQTWMAAQILPSSVAPAAAGLAVELNPQGGAPGIERLGVYAGGYLARVGSQGRNADLEILQRGRHVSTR